MKTVDELMSRDVVWVSPSAPVKSAVILMKGHGIGALPVVESDDRVVGLLTLDRVVGEPGDAPVADCMLVDFASIGPGIAVHSAAERMKETSAGYLLVLQDNKLEGILSRGDLLPELGKNFDPLTNLPWSDAFREWATASLKGGAEISVILFDINNFGAFNKTHGHVVGDRVIQAVADVIKKGADPELDNVCRYGGDEFLVGTTRLADEARSLADIIQERISAAKVEGLTEGVSATYGISGGRRSREREDIHYAATIDDLINRASKDCTARKPGRRGAESRAAARLDTRPGAPTPPASGGAARLRIKSVGLTLTGAETAVNVTLSDLDQEIKGESSGFTTGSRNTLRLVAEATASAACSALADEHGITVDEILLENLGGEEEVVTVVATFFAAGSTTRVAGSAVVKRGDRYRATSAALLASINRLYASAPRANAGDL